MATITTTKLLLLLWVLMLLTLVMEIMPLEAQSAGTSCRALILLVYTVWENYFLLPFYCKKAILKYGRSGQHMMQFGFIIKLVCCLGWLCGLASGQAELSDALTGSVTFPALGVTCIGNLAFFYTIILRGMPHGIFQYNEWKLAAGRCLAKRDKLKNLNQLQGLDTCQLQGLTTCPQKVDECHVVMLSMKMPNSSMEDFMRVMSNVHKVYSISLQCSPVRSESNVSESNVESCSCKNHDRAEEDWSPRCACIVFSAVEEVRKMLNNQIPGIVKRLSDSRYLLPCWFCLRNGCHLGHQGPSRENDSQVESPAASEDDSQMECHEAADLREVDSQMECPAAVCELLPYTSFMSDDAPCICLPLRLAKNDEWTKQLLTFFETRVNHVGVSSALKNYIFDSGECDAYENYDRVSLTIVPMLTEIFIICALIFWFKVDCLSTAMVADRALQGYPRLDYSPIAFLKRAVVRSNPKNTNACQVLWFRVSRVNPESVDLMMNFVYLICCISWMVLVALEGGANKWYHTHSMPPSEARVAVIIAAIGIAVGFDLYQLLTQHRLIRLVGRNSPMFVRAYPVSPCNMRTTIIALRVVIVLEILCIVSGSGVLGTLGIKAFGRWLYSAVQCLVLIKTFLGNAMALQSENLESGAFRKEGGDGRYVYASAFFVNGILAGVRAKWEYS